MVALNVSHCIVVIGDIDEWTRLRFEIHEKGAESGAFKLTRKQDTGRQQAYILMSVRQPSTSCRMCAPCMPESHILHLSVD